MSRAARSIQIWGIYAFAIGVALSVAPNALFSILGIAETDEVWIRLVGLIALALAIYYWDAARNETRNLFVASLLARGVFAAGLIVFWLTGEPWQLLLFAAVEVIGVTWTYMALRADRDQGAAGA